MTDKFDIVKLIEKNPITRLSKDYQSKLITKVKEKFTNPEQQLFVASFYCYLHHNSNNDFIIDFDNIWKWVGFTRKDNSKRLLEKYFVLDLDYKILLLPKEEQNLKQDKRGGNNKETILLTINTFKKFCLKADTKKADEIHNYYIKLEEVLHDTMNEETVELRNQLLIKDEKIHQSKEKYKKNEIKHKKIEEKFKLDLKLNKHKILIEKTKGKRCVYISEIEENKFIKIGSSKETSERHIQLNRQYGNSMFLEIFECDNFREVEESILSDSTIKKYLHRQPINGHMPQEVVLLTNEFNYNQLLSIVKHYVSQIIFLTPSQLLEKQKLDLEKQKLDLEKQKLDYNIIYNVLNNELYVDTVKEILNNNLAILLQNNQSNYNINTNNSIIKNNITIREPIIEPIIEPILEQSIQPIIDDTNIRSLETNETQNPNYNMTINLKIKGRNPMGQKIQKIDPDNIKNIIKVYDSMIYLLRSPENNGYQKSSIQTAIKTNKKYKGYRWNFVKKGDDPNISNVLPTVNFKSKIPIRSSILKLNSTKTEIIESFYTKDFLWKELKISKKKLQKIIENNELYNNYYYIEYLKCPNELLVKYNKPINRIIPAHSKAIKQINPITNEVIIFNTLSELYIKYGFCSTTIIYAIENKTIHGGFLWDYNT
jgi:hypothetical protein